jgi:hypothetical protein
MGAPHKELRRSKASFMHWPIEWLWVAVIVSVALLMFVGLLLGSTIPSENTGRPSPSNSGTTTAKSGLAIKPSASVLAL